MAANRLAGESSLYLRQHAHNPVEWYPWGPEALDAAKEQDRPIFLSIGYSACHWCHVMERESFEDEATAEVMNEHFVCVKVDREERPDLDQIYMTALQLLTREGGGWPLSVFLTPDLTPFYAGTYFPPKDMYGRPGFRRVLLAVAQAWETKRDQMKGIGSQVAEALKQSLAATSDEGELNEQTLRNALAALKRNFDPVHGGFGGAPKFPHPVDLRLLLCLHHRFGDAEALNMVTHTLTMMARGGIYDQIGGGFHRYSVDDKWLVPHFEKMLYDNALLVPVYLEADDIDDDDTVDHGQIAKEILEYTAREMTSPAGAFYSTQDADSEGEEGKFFVWSDGEIATVLGGNADFARQVWGLTIRGNFEGHNILCRHRCDGDAATKVGLSFEVFQEKLRDVRQKLYGHRSQRVWPGRDEKLLTSWNGLMIAAFAQGDQLEPARKAALFILKNMRTPDGSLFRTAGDDRPAKIAAYLEDYAYLIDGLVTLYNADFDAQWIATACELADIMIRDYYDAEHGGFFITLKDQTDVIARAKDWHDGATPSGNGVAATVLFKLAVLCDRPDYREVAEKTLHAFRGQISENPQAAAQMLIALDWHLGPVREVAVIGRREDDETDKVLEALRSEFQPRQVIAYHDPTSGESPSNIAMLRGKTLIDDTVTMYVCRNYQCDAPLVGKEAILKYHHAH